MARLAGIVAAAALLAAAAARAQNLAARPSDLENLSPQAVVSRFCQLDGDGLRVIPLGWPSVAPLVAWPFEPAWDFVVLISGYEIGGQYPNSDGALMVDVRYSVVGLVSAGRLDDVVYTQTVPFLVTPSGGQTWQVGGPPPPPHLFASRVDLAAMRRTLVPDGTAYLSNSSFVWRMMHSAGWNVPYEPTLDLLDGATYRAVERPDVGDLVVYTQDGRPYHVGLLAAPGEVASATLNAGLVSARLDAFPGEVVYLRLVEPPPETPTEPVPEAASSPAAARPLESQPVPGKQMTPTPVAQPSRRKAVRRRTKPKKRKAHGRRARPTPTLHPRGRAPAGRS
jgi:hypothetical protein